MGLLEQTKSILREYRDWWQLPKEAKQEDRIDRAGLPEADPGIDACVQASIDWLLNSQKMSTTTDGGSSRHFSLIDGWGSSYPETTGYIVPTLIDYAKRSQRSDVMESARKMADWLVSIQFEEGGFQGGLVDALPRVQVTFNTGQILMGLSAAAAEWGEPYRASMNRAATWLVETQDSDGCWRKYPTPFAAPGEKVYETHVAWGVFEAARVEGSEAYADAAFANVRWAMTHQRDNGWMAECCLTDPDYPLTHTLGYCLRGLVEANRYRSDPEVLASAMKLAKGLQSAIHENGHLPGCLDSEWKGAVDWVCLTGSVQIAHSFLLLAQATGDDSLADAGFRLNQFVRRTVRVDGEEGVRGGVKGSFPVSGGYGHFQYLNWAAKFMIDSNLLESDMRTNAG
ncbi:MAG: hypothetical protein AAF417_03625 [Pseudomonadota bacterium]